MQMSSKVKSFKEAIKEHQVALAICALGLALRLIFSLSLENRIYWWDGFDYDKLAVHLVQQGSYSMDGITPATFRPPGYPFFLSGVYALFGRSVVAVRVSQSILGALTILVLYLLSARIFSRRVGRFAAFTLAIYPLHVYLASTLFPQTLFTLFLALIVYFLFIWRERATVLLNVAIGILFAFGALVRPPLLVFMPVALGWGFIAAKQKWLFLKRDLWLILLSFMVVFTPWLYRNYHVLGTVSLATNGGRNFWLGNNEATTRDSGNGLPLTRQLQRKLAAAQTEAEKESIYYGEAFEFIRNQPLRAVKRTLGKLLNFWRFYPDPSSGYKTAPSLSKVLGVIFYTPVILLCLPGVTRGWRNHRQETTLFVLMVASFNLLYAAFFSTVRFRLPLDPFLILFASYALVTLNDGLSTREKS